MTVVSFLLSRWFRYGLVAAFVAFLLVRSALLAEAADAAETRAAAAVEAARLATASARATSDALAIVSRGTDARAQALPQIIRTIDHAPPTPEACLRDPRLLAAYAGVERLRDAHAAALRGAARNVDAPLPPA